MGACSSSRALHSCMSSSEQSRCAAFVKSITAGFCKQQQQNSKYRSICICHAMHHEWQPRCKMSLSAIWYQNSTQCGFLYRFFFIISLYKLHDIAFHPCCHNAIWPGCLHQVTQKLVTHSVVHNCSSLCRKLCSPSPMEALPANSDLLSDSSVTLAWLRSTFIDLNT